MEDSGNGRGELDTRPIPGTIHLVDLEGVMRGQHASASRIQDVVLVPSPSSDPDDPLNWSPKRKMLSTACMSMYTLMVGIASAAVYSVLEPISKDTGLTVDQLNAGTGYMFLFFGWGCLIAQPIALQYGKRPVYLFSLLATLGTMLWVPHATTNSAWIGSKILQGAVGAPIESLCEVSITDIYFTHERGAYMGLYAFMLTGSNFLAPILAGFINDGQGWRWVMYWCAIFLAIGFVFCFFLMEETNYDRAPPEIKKSLGNTPEAITPKEGMIQEKSSNSSTSLDPEKDTSIGVSNLATQTIERGAVHYTPKTYLQKLSLKDKKRDFRLFRMVVRPLIFMSLPSVAYAGFSYGSNLIWFNVLNGTASLILSAPPYNFSSSMVGLSYVSPLLGVACASFYSGVIGDRVVLWLARRNKGVLEAEHRLWLFLLSVILIPSSLILWGVGAAQHIHWFGLTVAMFLIAASNGIGVQLSVSYCIDAYKDLSGEAMASVIVIRNTMSFAMGYGITPWVTNMGYQNAFIVAAFAGLAQVLTFFAVVKWGKSWRNNTKGRYYKYLKESETLRITH
ncbi:6505ea9c-ed63-4f6a-a8a3-9446c1d57371 [Sclerotinia trifoliorum]|uniref:6505ea9c-ed63-4f6a-a8a3-9446c1d57371 n=1 Tax=Sclerotinia trifoliorum TaxID=28548 RepID=A0A8H2ZKB8_9HELO|nr:6505ea9c-ed63-4f6a-a8a3-9446c1d57371 [Sclerotinia trifoliorum]